MKKVLYITICLPIVLLSACDVHEWPDTPEFVKLYLRLDYKTEMTEWKHLYDGVDVIGQGYGETYDNHLEYGKIRYIVRTYPISENMRTTTDYTQEFVFTKDISDGYAHETTLDLLPGSYKVMVWSDLVQAGGDSHFHNADNFGEIRLQGSHAGNNDHRDAFRGSNYISLTADKMEHLPDTLDIVMQRPFAKFELVTNDVIDFIAKETARTATKANPDKSASPDETPTGAVNIEDYKVAIHYVGFMPDAYSMHTDKPVDSSTGVMFEGSLKKISESEATMGFDYVFVGEKESAVNIQIGIYDKKGTQLSLTEPIEVPLKRSHHTILAGMFMMSETSGGISINPKFDGDHNLIFP